MSAMAEKIYAEARRLPDALAQEVFDFICFVEARHGITPQAEDKPAPNWQAFFDRHTRNLDDAQPLNRDALYDECLR